MTVVFIAVTFAIILLVNLNVSAFLSLPLRRNSLKSKPRQRVVLAGESDDAPAPSTNLTLGFSQLRPFLDIAIPFFKEDKKARDLLLVVGAMNLFNSGVSVAFSYVSRDFYNALNARDEADFYDKIRLFFLCLCIAVPSSVYRRFLREKLQLYWRDAMTQRVIDKYLTNRKYYEIETLRDIDNPDQRITDDIRAFTKTSIDFFLQLFSSAIDLVSFSAILFQIYPGLFVAILVYSGVGSLVTTRLGRSLVSQNYERLIKEANFRFSLIRTRENSEAIAFYDANAEKEKSNLLRIFKEVLDNQMGIIRTQRNLEFFTTSYQYLIQILPSLIVAPLYFAKKVELGSISQSYGAFNHILNDFSIIINQFESLSAFSAGLSRLSVFLDRLEKPIWASADSNSSGMNVTEAGSRLLLPRGVNSLVKFAVVTSPTYASMSGVGHAGDKREGEAWNVEGQHDVLLSCKDLCVFTPDRSRILVGGSSPADDGTGITQLGINFEIRRGDSILVVGASGTGKSSLLRAISGLWRVGSGEVLWYTLDQSLTSSHSDGSSSSGTGHREDDSAAAAPKDVFFLPQKPYNVIGTLRDEITYPNGLLSSSPSDDETNAELLAILKVVKLGDLARRMGALEVLDQGEGGGGEAGVGDVSLRGLYHVCDWGKVLSLGEQQRVAFARVLYNRPSVVVLDEATSALDLQAEEAMYKALQDLGVTYISVGHRPSLLSYHKTKMALFGPGRAVSISRITDSDAIGSSSGALIDLTR